MVKVRHRIRAGNNFSFNGFSLEVLTASVSENTMFYLINFILGIIMPLKIFSASLAP